MFFKDYDNFFSLDSKLNQVNTNNIIQQKEPLSKTYEDRDNKYRNNELGFKNIYSPWEALSYIKWRLDNWMSNLEEFIGSDNLPKVLLLTSFATANEIWKLSLSILSLWERLNIACDNFTRWIPWAWDKVKEILITSWIESLNAISVIPEWMVINNIKIIPWKEILQKLSKILDPLLNNKWNLVLKDTYKMNKLSFRDLWKTEQEILEKTTFWLWWNLDKLKTLKPNNELFSSELWITLENTELLTDYLKTKPLNNESLKIINDSIKNLNSVLEEFGSIIKDDPWKLKLWKDTLGEMRRNAEKLYKITTNENLFINKLNEKVFKYNLLKFDKLWNYLITK